MPSPVSCVAVAVAVTATARACTVGGTAAAQARPTDRLVVLPDDGLLKRHPHRPPPPPLRRGAAVPASAPITRHRSGRSTGGQVRRDGQHRRSEAFQHVGLPHRLGRRGDRHGQDGGVRFGERHRHPRIVRVIVPVAVVPVIGRGDRRGGGAGGGDGGGGGGGRRRPRSPRRRDQRQDVDTQNVPGGRRQRRWLPRRMPHQNGDGSTRRLEPRRR